MHGRKIISLLFLPYRSAQQFSYYRQAGVFGNYWPTHAVNRILGQHPYKQLQTIAMRICYGIV